MRANDAQKQAICHDQGPCMVLAGPGSGKTYTLARRIQYLIERYKVEPDSVLVLTFNKAASIQMKRRFEQLVGSSGSGVTFGTFHGVYFGILRLAYGLNGDHILREEEKQDLIRQILKDPKAAFEAVGSGESEEIRTLLTEIGKVKNQRLDPAEYVSSQYESSFFYIYQTYEKRKRAMRKIDFDDMLLLCYDLLCQRAEVLKQWQNKFRYILIDEFQDINRIQYDVIRMLALPENNLFVVGDDDQSIYGFRGANPEIMLDFKKQYPDTKRILLGINYRSGASIVKGALAVIGHNTKRYQKDLRAYSRKESKIYVQTLPGLKEEGEFLIRQIRQFCEDGVLPEQMAVLYRTAGEARLLMELLLEYQVPFQTKDSGPNLYRHFIARNLLSYIKLSIGESKRMLFLDIMNAPNRYIGRESLDESDISFRDLREYYADESQTLEKINQLEQDLRVIQGRTPFEAIKYIRKQMRYDDYLDEYAVSHGIARDDLTAVLSLIEERAKDYHTAEEWIQHVEQYSEQVEKKHTNKRKAEGVHLMTLHRSKGLEFEVVFMIQANESVIPSARAGEDNIEEERRLFYVGMTRAKRNLIITCVKKRYGKELSPSRFVEELLLVKPSKIL